MCYESCIQFCFSMVLFVKDILLYWETQLHWSIDNNNLSASSPLIVNQCLSMSIYSRKIWSSFFHLFSPYSLYRTYFPVLFFETSNIDMCNFYMTLTISSYLLTLFCHYVINICLLIISFVVIKYIYTTFML